MPRYDFRTPRLHVDAALGRGETLTVTSAQAHYLGHVLRLGDGDGVLLFNGRDGEWAATLRQGRRALQADVTALLRPQPEPGGPDYWFAPIKHARLDYMVQKAVEMGARRLCPVLTRHTQVERVNTPRMRANVIEAAEQCGVLHVPEVAEPERLDAALDRWPQEGYLVFCDEAADLHDPVESLMRARERPPGPLAVLIGPEGGFSPEERACLLAVPGAIRLALGPRILRADTAAVAALTLVQAILGDWR